MSEKYRIDPKHSNTFAIEYEYAAFGSDIKPYIYLSCWLHKAGYNLIVRARDTHYNGTKHGGKGVRTVLSLSREELEQLRDNITELLGDDE